MFCSETVPLARMEKMIYTNKESFKAGFEISHFGPSPLNNAVVISRILDKESQILRKDSTIISEIAIGNCIPAGSSFMDLSAIKLRRSLPLKYP